MRATLQGQYREATGVDVEQGELLRRLLERFGRTGEISPTEAIQFVRRGGLRKGLIAGDGAAESASVTFGGTCIGG